MTRAPTDPGSVYVSPRKLTVDDLLDVVNDFADMLRLDDAGEDKRAFLVSEAAGLWPFAMPGHDDGMEPAGMDYFDRVLVRDLKRAFLAYRKRRDARGCP